MKLNKILLMFFLVSIAFASCKDNERENETIEAVETTDENFNERLNNARTDEGVVNAVEANPELSTFATGLNAWNLEDSISTMEGERIIFAPTNLAFSQVTQNTEAGSMVAIDDEELISYHIIETNDDLADLREEIRNSNDTLSVKTLQGEDLKLSLDGNSLVLTGATGESAHVTDSIQAGDQMVYIIDRVLLPRDTSNEVEISTQQ